MFIFNLFSVLARRRWVVGSLAGAMLLFIVILTDGFTGLLSSMIVRSYAFNMTFMIMAIGGVLASLIAVGAVSYYMHAAYRKETNIISAALTLTAFMFVISFTVSSFIYVPNFLGAVVVPNDDPAQAYALVPGEINIVLPWQGDIYTPLDGNRGTSIYFGMTKYHYTNVVIVYQGELADLYREWGSPQAFAEYWQQRCHQELDGPMASIDPETALQSLESQCGAFMPIEQILSKMVEGRGVTFRLNV